MKTLPFWLLFLKTHVWNMESVEEFIMRVQSERMSKRKWFFIHNYRRIKKEKNCTLCEHYIETKILFFKLHHCWKLIDDIRVKATLGIIRSCKQHTCNLFEREYSAL